MSRRPHTRGSPGARPSDRRPGRTRGPAACFALLLLAGCGDPPLRQIRETYEIVRGEPSVDPSAPSVDRSAGEVKPGDFASNAPVQVDAFYQSQVGKVDILWVVDNSGSMEAKQNKVKQNFQAFISKLQENNANVDYHIGVITTDTVNPAESGRLQNRAGLAKPWVGRDTCAAPACNAVTAFQANVSVGVRGSGDEKPFLALMTALTPPLSTGFNAGFVREDATLFVIMIGDEDDSSCAPLKPPTALGGGCSSPLQFGAPEYYARFIKGLKGYGRRDLVNMGAIIALDRNPLTVGWAGAFGCRTGDGDGDQAAYAARIKAVTDLVNGSGIGSTSICDADYLPALTNLGFLASGAKSAFALTRVPYEDSLRVYVTPRGGARTLQTRGTNYDYVRCSQGTPSVPVNNIQFRLQAGLPPAGSTIEAEYTVDVRGIGSCP